MKRLSERVQARLIGAALVLAYGAGFVSVEKPFAAVAPALVAVILSAVAIYGRVRPVDECTCRFGRWGNPRHCPVHGPGRQP